MKIYFKTRPQAKTDENIKSGFRKTGLNLFNPAIALRQLPSLPATPPHPSIPLEFQTPQNLYQLNFAIGKAEELDLDSSNDHTDDLHLIRSKIEKAATIAMAKEEILRWEIKDLRTHQLEQEPERSRKKRRVLGKEAVSVKEARAKKMAIEGGGRQQRKTRSTRNTRTRRQPSTSESSDTSSSESSDEEQSDDSTLIVCTRRL